MANPAIAEEKRAHRKRFRSLLNDLDPEQHAEWSALIVGHLANWLGAEIHPNRVALYSAIGTEADLSALHERLAPCSFLYPRVVSDGLEFCAVPDPTGMRRGPYGICEPIPTLAPIEATEIDVCLCPGLGFGEDGVRLGRGKAYYDRALNLLRPDVPRVGVGFSVQRRATLPHESHDVRMTHLVSEDGVREVTA